MAQNGTDPPADVYTPKNILITGGAGFIASHVAKRLVTNYPQYKVRWQETRTSSSVQVLVVWISSVGLLP